MNTGVWKQMIPEIALNAVAPYPFLNSFKYQEYVREYDVIIYYKVNDILLVLMFVRLYLALSFILVITSFKNSRAQRVCKLHGCEANFMFALKSLMQQKPWIVLSVALPMSILVFGYMLLVFESPLNEISGQDFSQLVNCMWNVIITLSSVGFGDIYPKTFFGRWIGIIICFWGVFIISFFVVTITNILLFTSAEKKAYNQLIKLFYKSQLKKKAVDVLSAGFLHKVATK